MKRYILVIPIVIMAALSISARKPADVPNVHVVRATSWVSDPDGVLSPAAIALADSLLDDINTSRTTEVAVAVVADLDGQDIDSYATELFGLWGIGKRDRDNGLLLLISRDDRRAAIRTGYGMEGVINDGRAGRIIRNYIAPNMKAGDPDKAVTDAVRAIGTYISDPEAADYLHSDQNPGLPDGGKEDLKEFIKGYAAVAIIVIMGLLVWLIVAYVSSRGLTDQQRYGRLERMKLPVMMALPLTLGVAVIVWLPLWLLMRHTRLHRHDCPNCGTRMDRVDEVHDNDYLTPAQDMEEKLNSVDYDVWLCPCCHETDIIPYVNRRSGYAVCPQCGARAMAMQANRILRQPTTRTEGQGIRIYRCRNCGNINNVPYSIAKVAAPPVIIMGGGGFGGRGGGGGFSGGSFGGGMTGGGGASGGW